MRACSTVPSRRDLAPRPRRRAPENRTTPRRRSFQYVLRQPSSRGSVHRGEDLVGRRGQIVDAVVAIEVRERHVARAAGARRSVTVGAERDAARARCRSTRRPGTSGSTVATQQRLAIFLHAEVDRLPPFVVLVVVVAARIQAEIAAERPHGAQVRRGDLRGACHSAGVAPRGLRASRDDVGERDAGADASARRRVGDRAQLGDRREPDERARRLLAALHVRQQVGAAGQQHRLARRRREQVGRLRDACAARDT